MKKIFLIYVLWMVLCASCTKERFVQEVRSCADCVMCKDWSWGNGVGSPSATDGFCSVRVLEDGELRMKYSVGWGGKLDMSGAYFSSDATGSYGGGDNFKTFKTSVSKNTLIVFRGFKCKVKNMKIVCDSKPTDDDFDDF